MNCDIFSTEIFFKDLLLFLTQHFLLNKYLAILSSLAIKRIAQELAI